MEKENWYNLTAEETAKKLETDLNKGLSDAEVTAKREKYGTNELKAKRKKTLIEKFIEQFKDFMIIILIIAAIVSGIVGVKEGEGFTDSIIILVVVLVTGKKANERNMMIQESDNKQIRSQKNIYWLFRNSKNFFKIWLS